MDSDVKVEFPRCSGKTSEQSCCSFPQNAHGGSSSSCWTASMWQSMAQLVVFGKKGQAQHFFLKRGPFFFGTRCQVQLNAIREMSSMGCLYVGSHVIFAFSESQMPF
jgi:hypothetical protein